MQKIILSAAAVIIVAAGGWYLYAHNSAAPAAPTTVINTTGSTTQSVAFIASQNLQGSWQSVGDPTFVRTFNSDGVAVDTDGGQPVSTGSWQVFTKDQPPGAPVSFALDATSTYVQLAMSGSQSPVLNYKITKLTQSQLSLVDMSRGSELDFTRAEATSTAGVTDQGFGVYSYECDEHVTFAIAPAPDMSTIHIAALAGAYPPTVTLSKVATSSGALYEGGGVMFAAHGETVTLGQGDSAINCSPVQVPGEAPFNFGD